MDDPAVNPAELRQALGFIRQINARLGYNRATARALREIAGPTASVLDVCCGSTDFAAHVDGLYVGLDLHAATLGLADEVPRVRANAVTLPFDKGAFDVAVCQMSLHHFDLKTTILVLAEMTRVTRRGWVAADLLRRRRASMWIGMFTMTSSPMVRHDARLSVRQAWSPVEARELAYRSGASYRETFGHRFLMTRRHGG